MLDARRTASPVHFLRPRVIEHVRQRQHRAPHRLQVQSPRLGGGLAARTEASAERGLQDSFGGRHRAALAPGLVAECARLVLLVADSGGHPQPARGERHQAGLDEIQVVVLDQVGKQRDQVLTRVGIVRADQLGQRVAVDIPLHHVSMLAARPFQIEHRVRDLRAGLPAGLARRGDQHLQPVLALQFVPVAGARLDLGVLVVLQTGLPVGAAVFGKVGFPLGVVRVVEVGERSLLIVHERDKVGAVHSGGLAQCLQGRLHSLVEQVPGIKAGCDF